MFRNIVWCGVVLAALLAAQPHAEAALTSARVEKERPGCCQVVRSCAVAALAGAAADPADVSMSKSPVADFAEAALNGFDWTTPILAAIGAALAWLFVARGPFV